MYFSPGQQRHYSWHPLTTSQLKHTLAYQLKIGISLASDQLIKAVLSAKVLCQIYGTLPKLETSCSHAYSRQYA